MNLEDPLLPRLFQLAAPRKSPPIIAFFIWTALWAIWLLLWLRLPEQARLMYLAAAGLVAVTVVAFLIWRQGNREWRENYAAGFEKFLFDSLTQRILADLYYERAPEKRHTSRAVSTRLLHERARYADTLHAWTGKQLQIVSLQLVQEQEGVDGDTYEVKTFKGIFWEWTLRESISEDEHLVLPLLNNRYDADWLQGMHVYPKWSEVPVANLPATGLSFVLRAEAGTVSELPEAFWQGVSRLYAAYSKANRPLFLYFKRNRFVAVFSEHQEDRLAPVWEPPGSIHAAKSLAAAASEMETMAGFRTAVEKLIGDLL